VPDDYDPRYIECRDYTHPWKFDYLKRGRRGWIVRFFECPNCTMTKWQAAKISTGETERPHYKPPPKYRARRGSNLTKRDYRAENIRRQLEAA
jgi:hypothetical protein